MSCGSCNNQYPTFRPGGGGSGGNGSGSTSGGHFVSNRQKPTRRGRFYSPRLQRATDLLRRPASVTWREFVLLVLAAYVLVVAYRAGGRMHEILMLDVGEVCRRCTAMQCLSRYWQLLFQQVFWWASDVVPWGLVAAVSIFAGEELQRAVWRR